MRKKLIALLILCTISLFASKTIIKIDDDSGDDYGAGNVIYPEDQMFNDGLFDLTGFEIEEEDDYYRFIINVMGKLSPVEHDEFQYSYNLGDDFYLPMIHIYIDQDHIEGLGFTSTIKGTNATIHPENAWEKVVVIAALPERFAGELNRSQPEIAHNAIIPNKLKISRSRESMSVKVPKNRIGEISPQWGFTVLMFCQEFSQTIDKSIYIKDIKSTSSQMNFGGGSGNFLGNYDPNIIDMILPLGKYQREVLANYDQKEKKYTEIFACYPEFSALKKQSSFGVVKQVSEDKIVVDLGSDDCVSKGMELIVDNRIIVTVSDIFPNLSIAVFKQAEEWESIKPEMNVSIRMKNEE